MNGKNLPNGLVKLAHMQELASLFTPTNACQARKLREILVKRFLVLLVGLLSSVATATPIPKSVIFDGTSESIPVYPKTLWQLRAVDSTVEDADADFAAGKFQLSEGEIPNFGHQKGEVWIYFEIQNMSRLMSNFVLSLDRPTVDFAVLHAYDAKIHSWINTSPQGLGFRSSQRPIQSTEISFPIEARYGSTTKYFLQIRAVDGISVPLFLRTFPYHLKMTSQRTIIFGSLYGLILLTLVYSLILYFVLTHLIHKPIDVVIFAEPG